MIGKVKDHLGVERVLNWQPGLPVRIPIDPVPPKASAAPPSMSLISALPPIRDQGDLGSCTAFSSEAPIWVAMKNAGKTPFVPSPLFTYYNERLMNNQVGSDAGAAIPDIFRASNEYGVCPESAWPYDVSKYTEAPPTAAYEAAKDLRAHIYAPLPQILDNLIGCIHRNLCPIDFGIVVYESFMTDAVAKTGIIPMPKSSEIAQGGHAIDLVGFNQTSQAINGIPPLHFILRNSWDTTWGAQGYGFLPFDYILSNELSSDFWMLRSI